MGAGGGPGGSGGAGSGGTRPTGGSAGGGTGGTAPATGGSGGATGGSGGGGQRGITGWWSGRLGRRWRWPVATGGAGSGGAGGGASPDAGGGTPAETGRWQRRHRHLELQLLRHQPAGPDRCCRASPRASAATCASASRTACRAPTSCAAQAAEMGKPGAGSKTWRAFLSATAGPGGMPVNARDRIGQGPWYDRNGRLLAMNLEGLFGGDRPMGDAQLVNDMTNERGEPNHRVGLNGFQPGAGVRQPRHADRLGRPGPPAGTGAAATCNDWTSASGGRSAVRSGTPGRAAPAAAATGSPITRRPAARPGVDRTLGGSGAGGLRRLLAAATAASTASPFAEPRAAAAAAAERGRTVPADAAPPVRW